MKKDKTMVYLIIIITSLLVACGAVLDGGGIDGKNTKSSISGGAAINAKAIELAYPPGTSKKTYKYSTGKPKSTYKKALDRVYKNHNKWGGSCKTGASCDVFVGTVVRASGYDAKIPRGLKEQIPYLAKSSKFKSIEYSGFSSLKGGDIIIYTRKSGGGHVLIVVKQNNTFYIAQASYNGKNPGLYGYMKKAKSSQNYFKKSDKKKWKLYRATDSVDGSSNVEDNTIETDTINGWTPIKITDNIKSCQQLLSDDFLEIMNYVFLIIKIVTPIILIVFTMLDFTKAVADSDDAMKKAVNNFIKRGIIALAIFLLPDILNFILNVTGIGDGTCGIG